jgi:hypothetical protein
MIRPRQSILCLAAVTVVFAACSQNMPPAGRIPVVSQTLAPPPTVSSPVAYFRTLLAMTSKERNDFLKNRSPEVRTRILIKVHEYEELGPDERELRLRATELRWYLMPLLQSSPSNRAQQLSRVPEDLRGLVKDRLTQWDILPPPLQQEFLQNDRAIYYFARIDPPGSPALNDVADARRQEISMQFSQFLELTPEEKKATLQTLSAAERAQMEKTLQSFEQMPPQQQAQCVNNYAKFAGMSTAERAEFLKNAERWSQMSPGERQTWRDLVQNVPEWPPLPAAIFPQNYNQPLLATNSRPGMATN